MQTGQNSTGFLGPKAAYLTGGSTRAIGSVGGVRVARFERHGRADQIKLSVGSYSVLFDERDRDLLMGFLKKAL
jgi:hypothetical protein